MKIKHMIYLLVISLMLTSCADAQQPVSESKVEQKKTTPPISAIDLTPLDELFYQEKAYGHFSGVLMIQYRDSVIYINHSSQLPAGAESRLDIGSVSKQFTAAAILSLVHEGLIKVDDPINMYLGKYTTKKWDKVTIHHLLTHTSGIPSIYQTEQGLDVFFPKESATSLESLISKFNTEKTLFSPGNEFSYSNSGYVLLAAIIEEVSGRDFFTFMHEEIFQKYGLNQTSFHPDQASAWPTYGYRTDLLKKAPLYDPSWSIGQGGIYSTANDLLKWTRIIQSEAFLSESLRAQFLQQHTNVGYGYGWITGQDGKIVHDGGTAGFMSRLSFEPNSEMAVVVLTNRSYEDISQYGKSGEYIKSIVEQTWEALSGRDIQTLPDIVKNGFQYDKKLVETSGITLAAKSDSSFLLNHVGGPLINLIPHTPIRESDLASTYFIAAARAIEKRKLWSLAKFCNGEMKFVCFSGLMGIGMKSMRKKTGAVAEATPYLLNPDYGLIRLHGEKGDLDLKVYFDEEGKIQGILENGFYPVVDHALQLAYTVEGNKLFIDGFPLGESSCTVGFENDVLYVEQFGRRVFLKPVN